MRQAHICPVMRLVEKEGPKARHSRRPRAPPCTGGGGGGGGDGDGDGGDGGEVGDGRGGGVRRHVPGVGNIGGRRSEKVVGWNLVMTELGLALPCPLPWHTPHVPNADMPTSRLPTTPHLHLQVNQSRRLRVRVVVEQESAGSKCISSWCPLGVCVRNVAAVVRCACPPWSCHPCRRLESLPLSPSAEMVFFRCQSTRRRKSTGRERWTGSVSPSMTIGLGEPLGCRCPEHFVASARLMTTGLCY